MSIFASSGLWVEIIRGGEIYRGPVVGIEYGSSEGDDYGNLLYLNFDGTIENLTWEKDPHRIITQDPEVIIYPEGVDVWMAALRQNP